MGIILETKRVIIKTPEKTDFNDLLALWTDPDVMKYIGDGSVQTKAQVQEFLTNAEPYLKEYGLGFFSAFEKKTGNLIGQAGLFHLDLNIKQSEIELAYRLHKKYWHLGYTTELAKALIHWGFSELSLPKIIAIVHPENERSRRVMEKSGMSYQGMIDYRESKIPCYEIYNNDIDYKKIKLLPASFEDYSVIQNLGRFYVYDMSEYMGRETGWSVPEDGLYECIDFKKYWDDKNSFPFLIRYENEIVGFAIVDKKGSDAEIDFNMAQFFILCKFKSKGIGQYIAHECFKKFPGVWEVMVIPGNEGAYRFWRATIKNYTNNDFIEYTRDIAHFNNSRKNIFKFSSNAL